MQLFTQQELPLDTLGETIRKLRKARGLRQTEVGEAVGVESATVSQWEANKRTPAREKLPRLMAILCSSKAEEREFFTVYHGDDQQQAEIATPSFGHIPQIFQVAEPAANDPGINFSFHFHNHLKGLLDVAGIRVQENFTAPPKFSCDFLTSGKTKIAVFAQPVPNLGWDALIGKIFLRPTVPPIAACVIVCPYRTRESEHASQQMHGFDNISIALPDTMVEAIRRHGG